MPPLRDSVVHAGDLVRMRVAVLVHDAQAARPAQRGKVDPRRAALGAVRADCALGGRTADAVPLALADADAVLALAVGDPEILLADVRELGETETLQYARSWLTLVAEELRTELQLALALAPRTTTCSAAARWSRRSDARRARR